jgi:peptidoglycan hydrolase-like protein with peptidoglycan-binding domain
MGIGRVKLQLVAFLLLSGGVALNLLVLQPTGSGSMARAKGNVQIAAAKQGSDFDTGSIQRSKLPDISASDASVVLDMPRGHAEMTRAVQRELQIRGYEVGTVDGIEGAMTRAAIIGYEADKGMPLTGRPSQKLLEHILLGKGKNGTDASRTETTEARKAIESVQSALASLGYKPGQIDGQWNAQTQRAIREFEIDQAMPETGRLSGPLVARLARLSDSGRLASGP